MYLLILLLNCLADKCFVEKRILLRLAGTEAREKKFIKGNFCWYHSTGLNSITNSDKMYISACPQYRGLEGASAGLQPRKQQAITTAWRNLQPTSIAAHWYSGFCLSFYTARQKVSWGVLLSHGTIEVVYDQCEIVQGFKKGQALLWCSTDFAGLDLTQCTVRNIRDNLLESIQH